MAHYEQSAPRELAVVTFGADVVKQLEDDGLIDIKEYGDGRQYVDWNEVARAVRKRERDETAPARRLQREATFLLWLDEVRTLWREQWDAELKALSATRRKKAINRHVVEETPPEPSDVPTPDTEGKSLDELLEAM
jgi:hypothetical protein